MGTGVLIMDSHLGGLRKFFPFSDKDLPCQWGNTNSPGQGA